MGGFEEVEQLRAGIREWVLRTARSDRRELRDVPARTVLPLLCAAAFGPALGNAAGLSSTAAVAAIGVLSSVGADTLAAILADAAERARSAPAGGDPPGQDMQAEARQRPQQEISRAIGEILGGPDERAVSLRSDIAMVMKEIDAGGTVFRAAIEAGDEETERDVIAAVEAVSTEFGDMAFLLADLIRAADEVQDSLIGQETELRAASALLGRQSGDVRMIREELAVIEQRTRHWAPEHGENDHSGPRAAGCPYLGLRPYDQAHQAVFFGRERLTAELTGKLAGAGIVMVTGGSGAGKTSLLQAGLVPALVRGVQLAGSSSWPKISMTPTARPLTELAGRLAALGGGDPVAIRQSLADAPGQAHLLVREILLAWTGQQQPGDEGGNLPAVRLVLIIDQFEQVFTDGDDSRSLERTAFIDAVCAAATIGGGPQAEPPSRVVIVVRGDYWDRCAVYPQLVSVMEQDQLVVGPMPEAQLRRAIAGPAEASGLRIESALIDAVLADTRTASRAQGTGVLPRLSQALMLTWDSRENDELTAAGYARSGRVACAVEVSAEAVYGGLPEQQQEIARDVFRKLTAIDRDRQPGCRPATRAELRASCPKDQWSQVGTVLDAFAQRHLLVLGTDVAEIAHDVLLQAWPRLRAWMEEDQTSLILHGGLAEDSASWYQNKKDTAVLYRGVQLAAARQAIRVWEADPGRYPALTPREADFLRASGRAGTRGKWRRRALTSLLVVLLVAALAGGGLAVKSARNTAARQQTIGLSGRLAAQSTAFDAANPATAALLAGAAWRISPTAQARYSLLESLAQPVRGILAASSGAVTALAYSPDGRRLAAGYTDHTIRLWDLASHQLVSTTTWHAAVVTLAFTSGGKALNVGSPGAAGRWDLANRATIAARLHESGGAVAASSAAVNELAFSPDGKTLATADQDGNVRLWDVATQAPVGTAMATGAALTGLTFSASGKTLATAESNGSTELWDATVRHQTGTPLATQTSGGVNAVAFSSDANVLATGDGDGAVRLWDPAGFHQAAAPLGVGAIESASAAAGHAPAVLSANGDILAVTGARGTVRLWNTTTRRQTGVPIGGGQAVQGLPVSPDGQTVAVTMAGHGLQLWTAAAGRPAGKALPASDADGAVVFSPDGALMATIGTDGRARLWDVATQQQTGAAMSVGGPARVSGPSIVSPALNSIWLMLSLTKRSDTASRSAPTVGIVLCSSNGPVSSPSPPRAWRWRSSPGSGPAEPRPPLRA